MLKAITGPWNHGVSSSSVLIPPAVWGLTLNAGDVVNFTGFFFKSSKDLSKTICDLFILVTKLVENGLY